MQTPLSLAFPLRLLQQLLTFLAGEPSTTQMSYLQWQRGFMRRRLFLVFAIALGINLGFTVPRFTYNWINHKPLPEWWYVDLCVIAGLGLSVLVLQFWRSPQALNFVFLGLSGSVNIIEQLVEVAMGGRGFDVLDDFFSWLLVFFLQATLIPVRWRLHLLCHVLTYGIYFFIKCKYAWSNNLAVEWYPREWTSPPSWLFMLFMISAVATLAVYLYERTARAEFIARKAQSAAYEKLTQEQQRSEALLRNILPDKIACRLKYETQTIADSFQEVSVLFADIVGFTQLSSQICPRELVELLNGIFSRFDQLAERHSLEKIKTIGDAYMVVAGLPEERSDHAEAIAAMALDIQTALRQFNAETGHNLNIRVGIHTGSVVAGVIGLKKFAYDIWGDTVNTASRMESHSLPGKIQVTEAVYQRLKSRYVLEPRGAIAVKGKGEMFTYWLTGRAQEEIAPDKPLTAEYQVEFS